MSFKNKLNILKAISSVVCLLLFITFVRFQYWTYVQEPTRINFNEETSLDVPFPAITICDKNYEYRRAHYDLGFSRNIFGKEPKLTHSSPYYLFKKLTLVNEDIVSNVWKYYFTLDQILETTVSDAGRNCRVGNSRCSIDKGLELSAIPTDLSKQDNEVEVEAGMWVSRILADSDEGSIFMCHTLIPNVSVSFSRKLGNSIGISFAEEYYKVSYSRQIYVHDRDEHVLLDSYAINTNPSFVVESKEELISEEMTIIVPEKRLKILPTKHIHPSPSDVHPCTEKTNFSQNWCNINHNWNSKINIMTQFYKENFTCISPGIWDSVGKTLPVCQHFEADDVPSKSLGLQEILFPPSDTFAGLPKVPSFKAPPLGVYTDKKSCIQKCSKYSYELKEEQVTDYENNDNSYEVYLYFPSPNLQLWTEYRLLSRVDFFAGVGGTLGLVLGMSILSLVFIVLDMTKSIAKRIM